MIANDPLSLVFIFCFLLGFGFFLVAALSGHGHGHAHAGGHMHIGGHAHVGGHVHVAGHAHAGAHAGHAHTPTHAGGQQASSSQQAQSQSTGFELGAYLNPTSIALFLVGFGLFGYIFHNQTSATLVWSLLLGAVGGLILAAVILALLSRIFAGAEGSTELDVVDRTGMLGKVSITIPEKGLGEIIYTSPGGVHKSIPARGLDSQGIARDQEVVVVNYENGVAEVDTWEHFMQEGVSTSQATPDELAQLRALLDSSSLPEMEMIMRQEPQKE